MTPAELLSSHRLTTDGLEPMAGGTVNRVWCTPQFVIRVGEGDHGREARLALFALALGMHTAKPVAWGENYSIWERLPGVNASGRESIPTRTWAALLDDLEHLHAHPPEPPASTVPQTWRGREELVERTQERAGWTPGEQGELRRLLGQELVVANPAFIHGDAYGANVLVDEAGDYLALLDWGCAAWASLEGECARLEEGALESARRRWDNRLDTVLLERIRLDLFLEVACLGRVAFDRVRVQLERAEAAA